MKHAGRAAMMLTHASYSKGREVLIDADLVQMAEVYPELRPVFEEAQFMRNDLEALQDALALAGQD